VLKKKFQNFLLIAIEMAVLSVFSQKKGLGPLGINLIFHHKNLYLEFCNTKLEAKRIQNLKA